MVSFSKTLGVIVAGLCMVVAISGCGVSQKKLDDAQKRINAIKGMGIGDNLLSSAEVYLSNAKTSKNLGNGVLAKSNFDSAIVCIQKAEGMCTEGTAKLKPYIDSAKASFVQRKVEVSGPQLRIVDSMLGLVDTALKINKLPDAKLHLLELDTIYPQLVADEKKGKETRPKVIGTWNGTIKVTDNGANAVKKDLITFSADGKLKIDEEMKGLTMQGLKEDWKFLSGGSFEMQGDTILMHVTHEQCIRQIYEHQKIGANGKERWEKDEHKPYDSTFTDTHKDRYMAFDFLKDHFTKK